MTDPIQTIRELLDNEGWHGSGEKDREEFYCEHCKQHALAPDGIQHTPQCIHTRATTALSEAEARLAAMREALEAFRASITFAGSGAWFRAEGYQGAVSAPRLAALLDAALASDAARAMLEEVRRLREHLTLHSGILRKAEAERDLARAASRTNMETADALDKQLTQAKAERDEALRQASRLHAVAGCADMHTALAAEASCAVDRINALRAKVKRLEALAPKQLGGVIERTEDDTRERIAQARREERERIAKWHESQATDTTGYSWDRASAAAIRALGDAT